MVNEKCVLVLETTLSAEDLFLNADSDLICLQTCLLFVFQVKSSAITQTHLPAFTKLSELTLYRLIFISRFCYVPILCLLLKVVWLAYLHCPYRNTILRWTGYILFRVAGMYALQAVYPLQANFGKDRTGEYQFNLYAGVSDAVFLCLHTFFECLDLVMYLSYSRRLYLHLKS